MIKKLSIIIITLLISVVTYGQTSYMNIASVKNYQDGVVIGEKTMFVNVTINNTMDTIYWSANDYYGGYFPITKVEVRGNKTKYRCNPNGYSEEALFTTDQDYGNTFCKLVIRGSYGSKLEFKYLNL